MGHERFNQIGSSKNYYWELPKQWWIRDFPEDTNSQRGCANLFFAKNYMKMKEFGLPGDASLNTLGSANEKGTYLAERELASLRRPWSACLYCAWMSPHYTTGNWTFWNKANQIVVPMMKRLSWFFLFSFLDFWCVLCITFLYDRGILWRRNLINCVMRS